jgi:hypothetical protein
MAIKFHEHPEYTENQESLETYRDLYEGDHRKLISPKYLWPHELEFSNQAASTDPSTGTSETVGQKIRRIRALRSRYFNLFEPVISTWISMSLSKPIRLDEETSRMLGEDVNNIDGKGSSLQNFIMNDLAISFFRDGKACILVDAPSNDAASLLEQQQAGFRPYMEMIDPLELKDWQMAADKSRYGLLDAVRYEYELIAPRTSLTEEPEEVEYTRIFQRQEDGTVLVSIYREDEKSDEWIPVLVDQPLDGFSELPVALAMNNTSWVKDVAELQLVLFNLMSAFYNQLNTQAFQRVFVSGDLQDKHLISISEYAVSVLPQDAKPYVIEPASTDALIGAIESTMDQLYRVAFNRTRGVSSGSKEAPGAATLREMSTELIALLIHAVGELEGVINQALKHYARFKGIEDFQGRVTLSRDITADDVAMQIQMFLTYRDEIRNVQSWRKAHLKKVAATMGYNEEELSEIVGDIDELEPLPQFNQRALPRGLTAAGTEGKEVNVPLPEPRVRDSNGQ